MRNEKSENLKDDKILFINFNESFNCNSSNSDQDDWLKVGKSFGSKITKITNNKFLEQEDDIKLLLNKKRAEDFFSSDENEEISNELKSHKENIDLSKYNLNKQKYDENIMVKYSDKIKKNKYLNVKEISDFSSDEEYQKNEFSGQTLSHRSKIEKFKIKNIFELDDKKIYPTKHQEKLEIPTKNEIYSFEDIINHLLEINYSKRKVNKFLQKLEQKKLKLHSSDIFLTIDLLSIKDNFKYGSLQKKDIPIFKRLKTNRIIGIKNLKLSGEFLKELNEMIGVYTKSNKKLHNTRYYMSDYISEFSMVDNYEIKSNKNKFDFKKDYLAFHPQLSEERIYFEDPLELKINYNLFNFNNDRILLEKNKKFNSNIKQDPLNIKLWIDFINFQDELRFQGNININSELNKREIKLNILDKALSYKENENNILLNLLYLRIFEDANFENLKIVNETWLKKLFSDSNSCSGINSLSCNKEFLNEYLNFIKSKKKQFEINEIRENYLKLLKFYENKISQNSQILLNVKLSSVEINEIYEFDIFLSKLIIDILMDLIIFEKELGYYEKSFNIIRSFLELNCLRFKNILKEKFFDEYLSYFDSEFPKLGDFEKCNGFIEYVQKKEKVSESFFYREDYIEYYRENAKNKLNINIPLNEQKSNIKVEVENFLPIFSKFENYNKNFRSLNITYDKSEIETKPESFIFYSDIKDYVEIKYLLNKDTLLHLIIQMSKYLSNKYFNIENFCYSCNNHNVIFLSSSQYQKFSENIILKFIFEEKFMSFPNLIKYNHQLYIYFLRFYDYLDSLNILREEVNLLKIDLIFSNQKNTNEYKLEFAKNLLKNNQNDFKLWSYYYKWLLYLNNYEDAEKVIKVLISKISSCKSINSISNNSEVIKSKEMNEIIKIKFLSIQHYIYYLTMQNPKYNIQEFLVLLKDNIKFVYEVLSIPNNIVNDIRELETILQKNEKLSYNLASFIICLLSCSIIFSYSNYSTQLNEIHFTQSNLIDKFKLITNYTNLAQIHLSHNLSNTICRHKLKQEVSIHLLQIFYYLKKNYFNIQEPKFEIQILSYMNNFNFNNSDIFILLYSKAINQFSNPIDREIKFVKHFSHSATLKHFHYFLKFRFNKDYSNGVQISNILSLYKNYWNIYSHSLLKTCTIFENFEDEKILTEKKLFNLMITPNVYSRSITYYYLKSLVKLIKTQGIKELHHFLDYSLFMAHEISYNKKIYLKFFEECAMLITDPKLTEKESEYIKKHVHHMLDIMRTKEIRSYYNINNIMK